VILTTVFGIALAAIAPLAVPLVYGSDFDGAVVPLLLLIPGIIAYSPASVLSAYFSMRHGRMRYPMIVAGTSATVNALLCLMLVRPFGATGAALASTGGYVIGSALLLAMFLRAGRTGVGHVVPRAADVLAYRDLALSLRSRVVR
jgi:O-antigen/teichoic acid export membrane protein